MKYSSKVYQVTVTVTDFPALQSRVEAYYSLKKAVLNLFLKGYSLENIMFVIENDIYLEILKGNYKILSVKKEV